MTLQIETHGAVELLRFNRPEKKNALTGEMYNAAHDALVTGASRGVKAFVFAGVKGAFTAGNDLMDFLKYTSGETPAFKFIRQLALNEIPLVAAVDGLAVGVGTTMLMHCDLVYATPNAMFKMPFIDLGLVPEAASSMLMPRAFGLQKASEYLLAGEAFNAEAGVQIGMVNGICSSEEVEAKAVAMAVKLASKPQEAMRASRRLLRGDPQVIVDKMNEESVHFSNALKSDEAKQAFMAFLSKAK